MKLTRLIKEGLISLNRGLEVINAELDEFNREQVARLPFRDVKAKSHEIQHVARIAEIIVPDDLPEDEALNAVLGELSALFIQATMEAVDAR